VENPQGAIDQINEITGNILGDTGGKKGDDKNKKNKKKDKNDPVGQVLDLLKQ
jgi:hypothetical protein